MQIVLSGNDVAAGNEAQMAAPNTGGNCPFSFVMGRGTLGGGSIVKKHKVNVVVLWDGKIAVDGLPALEGAEVEVSIKVPLRYEDPSEPAVDPSEWDALK